MRNSPLSLGTFVGYLWIIPLTTPLAIRAFRSPIWTSNFGAFSHLLRERFFTNMLPTCRKFVNRLFLIFLLNCSHSSQPKAPESSLQNFLSEFLKASQAKSPIYAFRATTVVRLFPGRFLVVLDSWPIVNECNRFTSFRADSNDRSLFSKLANSCR